MPLKLDYNKNNIVNLMSSIAQGSGGKTPYKPLQTIKKNVLAKKKNIILFVIDGLGYDFIQEQKGSFLKKHCKQRLSTTFPSTTAAGISTFLTGVAPQQHGLTGWYMFFKEIGAVVMPLPFTPRIGGLPLSVLGVDPERIFTEKAFTQRIKRKAYVIVDQDIAGSEYTYIHSKRATTIAYATINGLCKAVEETSAKKQKKYIYAYWSEFDGLCHKYGTNHKKTIKHFKELDKKIQTLAKKLKGTNTTMFICADHGMVNIPKSKVISLEKHPKLKACLSMPLCGEGRAVFCYVHAQKAKTFEGYVKKQLKKYCSLHKSSDLIKEEFFGRGKVHPNLQHRVGDYVLLMKENYVLRDQLVNEGKHKMIGHHGGLTKEELYVPLIEIEC